MNIQQHRINSTLSKKFRYQEGIFTRAEYISLKKSQGATVEQKEIRNHAAEEKLETSIKSRAWSIPFGNECHPLTKEWLNDEKQLAAGIFKTVYRLNDPSGTMHEITKTEFDYFNNL